MLRFRYAVPAFALTSAALLTGCPNREVSRVDPNQSIEQDKDIPVNLNRDIDILFVVDNSNSMKEEQVELASNFPRFIDVLQNIEGGLPNLHIGVVSSDVGIGSFSSMGCSGNGDDGALQASPRVPGCSAPTDNYISDVAVGMDGTQRMTNFAGNLADTFSCIANLGTGGCGFEHHLESMKRALMDTSGQNAGFIRKDAFLAVIIIADEDDCSASNTDVFDPSQDSATSQFGYFASYRCTEFGIKCDPDPDWRGVPMNTNADVAAQNCVPRDDSKYIGKVQDYVDFLKNFKGDPGKVIVATIVGNPSAEPNQNIIHLGFQSDQNGDRFILKPSCTVVKDGVTTTSAAPAIRLVKFAEAFQSHGTFQSLCPDNGDLSGGLELIAQLLKKVVGNPCLEGNLVLDGSGAPDCKVSDVQNKDTDKQVETPIPACSASGGATPCWKTSVDTSRCSGTDTPTHLSLEIDRGGGSAPPETTVVARCLATQ